MGNVFNEEKMDLLIYSASRFDGYLHVAVGPAQVERIQREEPYDFVGAEF